MKNLLLYGTVASSDGEEAEVLILFISESQKSVSGLTEAVPEIGESRSDRTLR